MWQLKPLHFFYFVIIAYDVSKFNELFLSLYLQMSEIRIVMELYFSFYAVEE